MRTTDLTVDGLLAALLEYQQAGKGSAPVFLDSGGRDVQANLVKFSPYHKDSFGDSIIESCVFILHIDDKA